MPQYTITPWRNYSELIKVKHDLFPLALSTTASTTTNSNDDDDASSSPTSTPKQRQQHAVHLVSAWSLRGKVPHAVQSTALLIEAQLHHAACSSTASAFSVRATYALAFCRFITGYCDITVSKPTAQLFSPPTPTHTIPGPPTPNLDPEPHPQHQRPQRPVTRSQHQQQQKEQPHQHQHQHPRSMHAAAATLGMPASWVDLRHAATHGTLPGVARLEAATAAALAWLWENYWATLGPAAASASASAPIPVPASTPASASGSAAIAPTALSLEADKHGYEQALRVVLEGFVRGRRAEVKEGDGTGAAPRHQGATREAGLQVIWLCKGEESKLRALVRVMVATRMMVAAERRGGVEFRIVRLLRGASLLSNKSRGLSCYAADMILREDRLTPESRPQDPMDGAFLIWTPLILTLAKYQTLFLPLLLKHIVSTLAGPHHSDPLPDVFRDALFAWVLHIVAKAAEVTDGEKIRSVVVSECVLSPANQWTGPLATRLVSEGDEAFRKRWAVYLPERWDE